MKKIMILGASTLQKPAIELAKQKGYEVAVVDYNPKAVGVGLADKFYCKSTFSEDEVLEAALDFRPHGIMLLATDWPLRALAKASETLGLKSISYKVACVATDKLPMANAFAAAQVPHPEFLYVSQDELDSGKKIEWEIFPCIVKPISASGSRGVTACRKAQEFESAIARASKFSKNDGVIIQELLDGPEVSVEMIVDEGEIYVLQITDKITSGYPYYVEIGHAQPSQLPDSLKMRIEEVAKAAVRALNINTGAIHAEIMCDTYKGPTMIELGARMGGERIATDLVLHSTGYNMTEAVMNLALDLPIITPEDLQSNPVAISFIIPPQSGKLAGYSGVNHARSMPGVIDITITIEPGYEFEGLQNSLDRPGYVIAMGETVDEAVFNARRAVEAINIVLD